MVSTTPLYGLPYPDNSDQLKAAVKSIPQSLAEQVESSLAGFGGAASPGSWQTPTFGTGWAAWSDTANELVRYRKIGTEVTVNGLCRRTSGTSVTMFTLPVGYRPTRSTWRFAQSQSVMGLCIIATSGNVDISIPGGVTNGNYVSIWAVYHTDQP